MADQVMVATDLGPRSVEVTTWAARHASALGGDLTMVVVEEDLEPDGPRGEGQADVGPLKRDVEAAARALADEVAAAVNIKATLVVRWGSDPAAVVVEEARTRGIDVLVVGNVGMRGRREFLLGNVANRITHSAPCTVVVVNTASEEGDAGADRQSDGARTARTSDGVRMAEIARTLSPLFLRFLAGRASGTPESLLPPQKLREALEELGPTF